MENCKKTAMSLFTNQRIHQLNVMDCMDCTIQVHDSVVFSTQICEFANVENCKILFDTVDVRIMRFWNVRNCIFQFTDEGILIDDMKIYLDKQSTGNKVQRVYIKAGTDPNSNPVLPIGEIVQSWEVNLDGNSQTTPKTNEHQKTEQKN